MRKRFALLLVLLLLLTGCGAQQPDAKPSGSEEQKKPVTEKLPEVQKPEPAEPEDQAIRFAAEAVVVDGVEKTEDGLILLTHSFQIPVLKVLRGDGTEVTEAKNAEEEAALAKAKIFNDRFAEWIEASEVEETVAAAEEHLKFLKDSGMDLNMVWVGGYAMDLSCGIYQTENLVSVSGLYYSYTGGAHPNTYHMGWNFDLETGTFLDVKLLGDDAELQNAVMAEIIRQARLPQAEGWIPAEMYWENYATIVADWSSYAVHFDENGMSVTFSAYELAPYAAGAQEFHVSYDWLKPYLSQQGIELLGL